MIAIAKTDSRSTYQPPSADRRADLVALIAGMVAMRTEATLRERLAGIPAADFGGDEEARWLTFHLYTKTLDSTAAERRYRYLTGAMPLDEWGRFIAAARAENRNDEHRARMREDYTTNRDRCL